MKKIIQKVQDLTQKAAHLKQLVEAAPAQAAHLRDTVLMTASQLQQIRSDVQSTVSGLRADSDDRLVQALKEINDSARTFLEAGYALTGVDMDLSPVQRLIVHLEKVDSATEQTFRSLLSANSGRQTVYAILGALAKADGVSEKIHVSHLTYRELSIHVGPTPAVRLSWRSESEHEGVVEHTSAVTTSPVPASSTPPPMPAFAQSSFFEQRSAGAVPRPSTPPPPPLPEAAPASAPAASVPAASHTQATPPPHGGDWKSSALDRFKKMPEGSKYRRMEGY